MTTSSYIWVIALLLVVCALVYATKRGWISWRGGRGIATLTVFHDFQPRTKQEAIEYVMERKAGKRLEADESGEGGRDAEPGDAPPVHPDKTKTPD